MPPLSRAVPGGAAAIAEHLVVGAAEARRAGGSVSGRGRGAAVRTLPTAADARTGLVAVSALARAGAGASRRRRRHRTGTGGVGAGAGLPLHRVLAGVKGMAVPRAGAGDAEDRCDGTGRRGAETPPPGRSASAGRVSVGAAEGCVAARLSVAGRARGTTAALPALARRGKGDAAGAHDVGVGAAESGRDAASARPVAAAVADGGSGQRTARARPASRGADAALGIVGAIEPLDRAGPRWRARRAGDLGAVDDDDDVRARAGYAAGNPVVEDREIAGGRHRGVGLIGRVWGHVARDRHPAIDQRARRIARDDVLPTL